MLKYWSCYSLLEVPDKFLVIDIECIKIGTRMNTFMIGMLRNDKLVMIYGDEISVLKEFQAIIKDRMIIYNSSRRFDEAVLKGIWQGCRRGLRSEPKDPDYPFIKYPDENWINLKRVPHFFDRSDDIPSEAIPIFWKHQRRIPDIIRHCAMDVLEVGREFFHNKKGFEEDIDEMIDKTYNNVERKLKREEKEHVK